MYDIESESDEISVNASSGRGRSEGRLCLRRRGGLRGVLLREAHHLHEEGLQVGRERGRRQLVALGVLHLEA